MPHAAGRARASARPAPTPASTPAAAAPSSARSAPSSTCRGASRAAARPTTSSRSCAPTSRRGCAASSSPTTISPATRTGRAILDRLIHLREVEKTQDSASSSRWTRSATGCRTSSRSAARAGVQRVFIGLENINPDNLARRQEAAEQDHRIPQDAARLEAAPASSPIAATSSASRTTRRSDPARHRGDQEASCRSICWSSSILTPLPGSEDHQKLCAKPASRWIRT